MRSGAEPVAELAARLEWPLVVEPTANITGLSAGHALLADEGFVAAHAPEVVLQFGATPTTRAALSYAASADRLIVADPDLWRHDPTGTAETITLDEALRITARGPSGWIDEWRRADDVTRAAMDAYLDEVDAPSELRLARDLGAAIAPDTTLFVGNSTPVRDLTLTMVPRADVRVLASRGASGIDGQVSTAFGIAWSGGPVVALLGDLTMLHDAGSLLWQRGLAPVFVVPNNGGGGIFDLLPSGALPENDEYFVTPHDVDLGDLARAAGAHHIVVTDGAIGPALSGELPTDRPSILEVAIDRARAVAVRREMRAAIARALHG